MPLREISPTRQISGEDRRKWFSSATMDLIVWFNEADDITGFQICYGKGAQENAFTWTIRKGFSHMKVDDGEGRGELGRKASPVLTANADGDMPTIALHFEREAEDIPEKLRRLILSRIDEYASSSANPAGS